MRRPRSVTLSVVVPCYNEADTISSCLEGLISQDSFIDEIIIVDNNSSDTTVATIKAYMEKHQKITLLHEKKQGVQFARNTGLSAANSDVIARIDADTIVGKKWATALVDFYDTKIHNNVGAASGQTHYFDIPFPVITQFFTNLFTHLANQKLADSHSIYGANMSLRREAWQQIRSDVCMRSGIMEDQDLGYHIIQAGFSTGYIAKAIAQVSGRRMRMSPLRYWRYNKQWWMTYENHGQHAEAARVRMMAWLGNVLQAVAWVGLSFHNPQTGKFSVAYLFAKKNEREIP